MVSSFKRGLLRSESSRSVIFVISLNAYSKTGRRPMTIKLDTIPFAMPHNPSINIISLATLFKKPMPAIAIKFITETANPAKNMRERFLASRTKYIPAALPTNNISERPRFPPAIKPIKILSASESANATLVFRRSAKIIPTLASGIIYARISACKTTSDIRIAKKAFIPISSTFLEITTIRLSNSAR